MTSAPTQRRLDSTGRRIRVGDIVRVIGVPDLDGMSRPGLRETLPILRFLVGRYKRVVGFDERGLAELAFRIATGRNRGLHTVWIEPHLLRVRRPRARP